MQFKPALIFMSLALIILGLLNASGIERYFASRAESTVEPRHCPAIYYLLPANHSEVGLNLNGRPLLLDRGKYQGQKNIETKEAVIVPPEQVAELVALSQQDPRKPHVIQLVATATTCERVDLTAAMP